MERKFSPFQKVNAAFVVLLQTWGVYHKVDLEFKPGLSPLSFDGVLASFSDDGEGAA